MLDQDLLERPAAVDTGPAHRGVGIEVIGRDLPQGRVLSEDLVRTSRVAHAEPTQRLGPRAGSGDGRSGLEFGVTGPA
jgi:hypothetical protein